MNILISGGTGFIGHHLSKRLIGLGHNIHLVLRPGSSSKIPEGARVYRYDGNITNLIDFLKSTRFDGVIHLATFYTASHDTSQLDTLLDSNIIFATHLLEAATQTQIPWFINTGTTAQNYKGKEYSPTNLYSATKQAFEDIGSYYSEANRINFVTVVLSDTFGPGDTRMKIMSKWYGSQDSSEIIKMSGGKQMINMIYIDNVVDG